MYGQVDRYDRPLPVAGSAGAPRDGGTDSGTDDERDWGDESRLGGKDVEETPEERPDRT